MKKLKRYVLLVIGMVIVFGMTGTVNNVKAESSSVNQSGTLTRADVKAFQANVEKPADGLRQSGDLQIEGWAIYGNGVSEVVTYLNGVPVCNCERVKRGDVASAFPGYPTGNEGFRCKISESLLRDGQNQIFFRAYTNHNTQIITDFGHRTINHIPKKPLISNMEYLPNNLVTDGTVGGWVITDTPQKVVILINGKQYEPERFKRDDVKKVYPAYDTSKAGFRLRIDPTQVMHGSNQLIVRAYTSSNEYKEIYKGNFSAVKMDAPLFDAAFYYGRYSSSDATVKSIGRNYGKLIKDWYTRGLAKGYACSAAFDPVYYLNVSSNSDIKKLCGNDYVKAYCHWVNYVLHGNEFRDVSPFLNLLYYKESYEDLQGKTPSDLVYHYVNWGCAESRVASSSDSAAALHKMFHAERFADKNGDLLEAYGDAKTNAIAYWQHFWYYTIPDSEKRYTNEGFDMGFVLIVSERDNAAEAVEWYLDTGYKLGYDTENKYQQSLIMEK